MAAGAAFGSDSDVLRTQGGAFKELGVQFGESTKTLKDALGEAEKDWGNDIIGKVADFYTPIRDGIVESMEHLAKDLGEMGANLEAMAANYDKVEEQNTSDLHVVSANRPNLAV
ncbi:hypothetical protein [Streptomyces sp. NPDC059122]|uniref:hypothetical protein n=1 Tax=unclassified Streptomyces TaxID=2593676 RepID=UPI0036A2819E